MSDHTIGDAPIEPEYRAKMIELAHLINEYFNGDLKGSARTTGFVLLVFPFGEQQGRCNYLSNGVDRDDIKTLFREQIARFEGSPDQQGRG